jgi:hypothetical protein
VEGEGARQRFGVLFISAQREHHDPALVQRGGHRRQVAHHQRVVIDAHGRIVALPDGGVWAGRGAFTGARGGAHRRWPIR